MQMAYRSKIGLQRACGKMQLGSLLKFLLPRARPRNPEDKGLWKRSKKSMRTFIVSNPLYEIHNWSENCFMFLPIHDCVSFKSRMGMSRSVARYAITSPSNRMMGALSRVAKSAFTKFPSPSPRGCGSALSPFSTTPLKTTKRIAARKVDEPPKPKKTYMIDDLDDEMQEFNKGFLNPILASPLVQVFSVSVNTNFDDDDESQRSCELYGTIRAIEGEGTTATTFSLYDRNHDNPETILKHGDLSLIGPQSNDDFSCCLGTTTTRIELDLKEKTRNIELIKSHLILDSNTEEIENSYDQLKTAIVGAEHGFALVKYATFRFAVFAFVETAIFAKYDVSRPVSEIYGSIVAGYANSRSYYCCKDDDALMSSMKCTLFNRPPDEPEQATVCTPLSLSRCVVAVPVHSSLKIEAHLWDHNHSGGPFASGFVEFLGPLNACNKLIRGEGGSVVVSVTWDNALKRVYTAKEEEERRLREVYTCAHQPIDDHHTMHIINKPQQILQSKPLISSTREILGYELVEVFSIFVDSKANEVPSLCGWVEIHDILSRFHIFEHDISDPEFCSTDKRMISVEGHRPIGYCDHFGFGLYLKDPVLDVVISDGVSCKAPICPWPCLFSWYDERLCCVIRGAHGYAVMHYIVFREACTASIEMTIIFSDDDDVDAHGVDEDLISTRTLSSINIHGCVFARYKSHDYSSMYAKKYYQSKLFDKPESESVELTTLSSKLPLLKSVVSMPLRDSLIVEVNLYDNLKQKVVVGVAEFEVDGNFCTIHKKIQGHRYCVLISAQIAEYF